MPVKKKTAKKGTPGKKHSLAHHRHRDPATEDWMDPRDVPMFPAEPEDDENPDPEKPE